MCFEPTYKELKHGVVCGALSGASGFEPTYKELKQPSTKLATLCALSFEPTYKELKQFLFIFDFLNLFSF